MNENAKKWVEALRSGEFEQATATLRRDCGDSESYCCLGVACELYRREHGGDWEEESEFWVNESEVAQDGELPPTVRDWLGLAYCDGGFGYKWVADASLIERNDSGAPFAKIADLIESDPNGLFQERTA